MTNTKAFGSQPPAPAAILVPQTPEFPLLPVFLKHLHLHPLEEAPASLWFLGLKGISPLAPLQMTIVLDDVGIGDLA